MLTDEEYEWLAIAMLRYRAELIWWTGAKGRPQPVLWPGLMDVDRLADASPRKRRVRIATKG